MKNRKEIEDRIDAYFANITPDELLRKVVEEYGFEIIEPIVDNFSSMTKKDRYQDKKNSVYSQTVGEYALAA
jgi:hypothetical protein